jgi:hypothetical protein
MHHQWVASYPSIAFIPGRFTQRGYLLPISGWHRAHPLLSKKHRMVRPSISDSHLRPPPHTQLGESSTRTAASQHEPNQLAEQYQTARMKLMFVRWFGRPFWTHTEIHLVVYTHCPLDGPAVHFGLTPRSTS